MLSRSVKNSSIEGEEEMWSYPIDLQCVTDMLDSLIPNSVHWKSEWHECLRRVALLTNCHLEETLDVLDWPSTHQPESGHLHGGFGFLLDPSLSVSEKNERISSIPDQTRSCPTWLILNASLRYRAPSSPILLSPRWSVVSVCEEWTNQLRARSSPTWLILKASLRHRAPSTPIRFARRSSVLSVYGQRRGNLMWDEEWFVLTRLTFNAFRKCWTPFVLIPLPRRWSDVSAYRGTLLIRSATRRALVLLDWPSMRLRENGFQENQYCSNSDRLFGASMNRMNVNSMIYTKKSSLLWLDCSSRHFQRTGAL